MKKFLYLIFMGLGGVLLVLGIFNLPTGLLLVFLSALSFVTASYFEETTVQQYSEVVDDKDIRVEHYCTLEDKLPISKYADDTIFHILRMNLGNEVKKYTTYTHERQLTTELTKLPKNTGNVLLDVYMSETSEHILQVDEVTTKTYKTEQRTQTKMSICISKQDNFYRCVITLFNPEGVIVKVDDTFITRCAKDRSGNPIINFNSSFITYINSDCGWSNETLLNYTSGWMHIEGKHSVSFMLHD